MKSNSTINASASPWGLECRSLEEISNSLLCVGQNTWEALMLRGDSPCGNSGKDGPAWVRQVPGLENFTKWGRWPPKSKNHLKGGRGQPGRHSLGGRRLMTKGIKEPQVSHCPNTQVFCPKDSFLNPACSSLRQIVYTDTSCPQFQLLISTSSNAGICKKTYRQTISNCFWNLPFWLQCARSQPAKANCQFTSQKPREENHIRHFLPENRKLLICPRCNHFFRVLYLKNIQTMSDFPPNVT